ncbi:MAG: sulfite exporter TauE/SafE family protein, partial [Eudoraea sp.]
LSFSRPVYQVIGKIKSSLGKALKKKTADTFLTIGFLNGFLPCGLVYMALLGAIAMGTAVEGSLYMILFGLGTVPLMTTAVYLSGILKDSSKRRIRKLIPVFVVIIGLLFILRGMGLGIPYVSPKPMVEMVSTELECH